MSVFDTAAAVSTSLPSHPADTPWPTHGWPEGGLRDEVDADRLTCLMDQAFPDAADSPLGMSLALAIVHRGRLVLERYGPTAGPQEPLISWSMGKSLVHALVGVLVAEGRLDLNQPIAAPEWMASGDERGAITLDHLLRMVGGTEFVEDYVEASTSHCIDMLFGSGAGDVAAYAAALPAVAPPGTVFNYSSGTSNIITRRLGEIVGAGSSFESWMRRVLLDPIGMQSATLTFDEVGTWVGSSFLRATARDFAKFGLLYLRDGVWDGRRLLPEGWVDYARTPRASNDEGKVYGAHWWIWDPDRDVFAACGYETQRILVDPGSDLVVVRLGKSPAESAPAVDAWLREVLACFRG